MLIFPRLFPMKLLMVDCIDSLYIIPADQA